jgi:hypothetical protein
MSDYAAFYSIRLSLHLYDFLTQFTEPVALLKDMTLHRVLENPSTVLDDLGVLLEAFER